MAPPERSELSVADGISVVSVETNWLLRQRGASLGGAGIPEEDFAVSHRMLLFIGLYSICYSVLNNNVRNMFKNLSLISVAFNSSTSNVFCFWIKCNEFTWQQKPGINVNKFVHKCGQKKITAKYLSSRLYLHLLALEDTVIFLLSYTWLGNMKGKLSTAQRDQSANIHGEAGSGGVRERASRQGHML